MNEKNLEYLNRIVNTDFPIMRQCEDCDVSFPGRYDYQYPEFQGHIAMKNALGEWGIVMGCEGYHMIW